MTFFKKIFKTFLFSNIYVSLAATLLTYQTFILLKIDNEIKIEYSLFVFFATVFLYNLQRVFLSKHYREEGASARQKWILQNKFLLLILLSVSFLGITICIERIGFILIWMAAPFFVLSVFYFLPFIKLRSVIGIKSMTVSVVWAAITVSLPFVLSQTDLSSTIISSLFSKQHLLLFLERFFFILPLAIVFNIRDIETDKRNNVVTIATVYGVKKTINISYITVLIFMAIVFAEHITGFYDAKILTALLISGISTSLLLALHKKLDGELYYVFGIDGLMILQALLIIIQNNL